MSRVDGAAPRAARRVAPIGAAPRAARRVAPIGAALALCVLAVGAVGALAKPTSITTHQTKRGRNLAAANGHALYMFSADKPGSSRCIGACANAWLPLLTSGRPVAAPGSGVDGKLLGTIRRGSHALQVTYNGHPLYLFARDRKPGQISGEGANQYHGHWYILSTSGNAVKPKASGGGGNLCNPICQGY